MITQQNATNQIKDRSEDFIFAQGIYEEALKTANKFSFNDSSMPKEFEIDLSLQEKYLLEI